MGDQARLDILFSARSVWGIMDGKEEIQVQIKFVLHIYIIYNMEDARLKTEESIDSNYGKSLTISGLQLQTCARGYAQKR